MTLNIQSFSVFLQFSAASHILRVNCTELLEIDLDNLCMKFLCLRLSFNLLHSMNLPYGGFTFGYFFKMNYYFIAYYALIAQVTGLMLSRIT